MAISVNLFIFFHPFIFVIACLCLQKTFILARKQGELYLNTDLQNSSHGRID